MTTTLHVGDAARVLETLPEASVHCAVTSPPYWGLRRYGAEANPGAIGREPTFEAHLEALGRVLDALWRCLRDDGTLWLAYGDRYWGGGANAFGWKTKDRMDMPGLVSTYAMRAGWYRRQEVVIAKSNALTESVGDRPRNVTEKLYQLTKHARGYYYDRAAVRIATRERAGAAPAKARHTDPRHEGAAIAHSGIDATPRGAHHLSNVWTLATAAHEHAGHPAPAPIALCATAIRASTSAGGACAACGTPWMRIETSARFAPACACATAPAPSRVLDPFGGSGTTAIAAARLGRDCTLIELNPDYAAHASERIAADAPLVNTVTWADAPPTNE